MLPFFSFHEIVFSECTFVGDVFSEKSLKVIGCLLQSREVKLWHFFDSETFSPVHCSVSINPGLYSSSTSNDLYGANWAKNLIATKTDGAIHGNKHAVSVQKRHQYWIDHVSSVCFLYKRLHFYILANFDENRFLQNLQIYRYCSVDLWTY